MEQDVLVEPIVQLVTVDDLRHIEGFSQRRVDWLKEKILSEGIWTKPLALCERHALVMDGQHRMEVARALDLRRVPAVRFSYSAVTIWSLRPDKYDFDWKMVTQRALSGDIYPYKTVKHGFPVPIPSCRYTLDELR
jgi:hypothetical protein